ncbi:glycosyltransferase family 2 protein [Adlercreutzia equolifaciens]|uniref:glycosyltransferase family 2 protein n=1 Tax=Adlercreutzia equolifaciens TaxID=446660 RepID=UPI003AF01ECC
MTACEPHVVHQPRTSVIVPAYNKAPHLKACFDCLECQTISKSDLEVLLIDDGSTDDSLALCEAFAAERPWVRVIAQPNAGVSEARNAGIRAANGRYLFFLDPDDSLSPETLENVSMFFESCPDEIDLVTYPIVSIRDGKRQRLHHRYDVLRETGVYDLTLPENATIAQATMNVAVRNCFDGNVLFDFAPANGVIVHEDEKYCTDVLQGSMQLGFCAEAEYRWMRSDEGASTALRQPERLYDNNIALFEDFFGRYGNEVPPYIQGLLVNDLSWKLKAGIALPTHLEGAAYDRALGRLGSLMERVDDDLILRHPNLREEHRLFALNLKCREPLRWRVAPGALAVLRGDALVFAAGCASATLTRIAVRDGELHVSGTLSSPFFAGWEGGVELLLRRRPRKADRGGSADALALTEIVEACPTATVKLGRSFRFDFTCNLDESEDIWLDLRLDGVTIPLAWSVRGLARSAHALRHERIVGSWRVRADLGRSKIAVDRLEGKALQAALKQHDGRVPRWKTRLDRRLIRHLLAGSEIWLYSDGPDAEDEARTMFECDSLRDDGIVRYYAARSGQAAPRPCKHGRIVRFGSRRHKMLFCAAQRIIAPTADFATYCPMPEKSLLDFADLFNGEVETASVGPLPQA